MSTPDFSDGTMIALSVPPGTASRIAVPGGTPVDEMHCTLAFLGNASALSEDDKQGIVQAAREAAHDAYPLPGNLPSRVGTFPAGEDGVPYWADPGAPGVHGIRENLMRSLSVRGLDHLVSQEHDFNPHVTLSYLPEGAQPPDPATVPSPEPFTFTHLIVKIGPDAQTFPLGASTHVDSTPTPEPDLNPATESPLPVAASARVPRARITQQTEHALRTLLAAHNSSTSLGQRTCIEVLKAVYLRGANEPNQASVTASARVACGTDRVHAFLAAVAGSSQPATAPDQDLFPPAPARSSLYPTLQLASSLRAYEVHETLTAALLHPPSSPKRAFQLNRALALSVTSPTPAIRAALPAHLRALVADGNSRASRSLRAKRQLRDRYGRWIEMGGGVRFKVRSPGAPGGGQWYHGTVEGQDVPNGLVNVKLDDGSSVAVPADKIEQPLAILRTDPRGVGNRPQDANAPTVSPTPPQQDDTGVQPTPDETHAALEDANAELAKRVKDDSTEAHHRDTLTEAAGEAVASTGTPDELADHLASLSEYADNVARGNAGRMTPEEREAFTAYAEDLQDIIAAQRPTEPAKARLPETPQEAPAAEAPPTPEAPAKPDAAEPVSTGPNPDDLLPELSEFSEAAQAVQAAHQATPAESPARDRLATVNNVVENVGEDFLSGELPADEAMDALNAAHDELDSILNDHFDDVSEGESDIEDAMDRVKAISAKIQTWNDTPDSPSPEPDAPDAVPEEAPDAGVPADEVPPPPPGQPVVNAPNARSNLSSALDREEEYLDEAEDQGAQISDHAREALQTMRVALDNADGESPEDQMMMLDGALNDYVNEVGDGTAYSLQNAVDRYRQSIGLQAPAPDREYDPWADPTPRAAKSPAETPTPDEIADPANYPDETDPLSAERLHFEDMKADYENGLLEDHALTPAIQEMINDLEDKSSEEGSDEQALADEIRQWFNRREPVTPQPTTDDTLTDQNGEVVNPGEWVDVDNGTIKGEFVRAVEDGIRVRAADGTETNVRGASSDNVRKMSAEEVEAEGGDPTGRGLPPVRPAEPADDAPSPPPEEASGETDQFDNPVPARMKLNRETNLPGGRKVQVYNFDDDPDGSSKVDVAVGPDPNGDPRYVVRYRSTARSNHDNWDDAVAAAQQELDRVQGNNVQEQARRERVEAQRAEQDARQQADNARRQEQNVDDADRPLPEGWSRDTLPGGTPVLTGPGRYRAFTDANGDLHLMVRDNQGGFAAIGSFPDWPQLEEAMNTDSARRTQAQRDEMGEWLAGHGFSQPIVNSVRVNPSAQATRNNVQVDKRYQEMADAKRDADESDVHTPQQRAADNDWRQLQEHLANLEDLPGDEAQPAPDSPDAAAPRSLLVQGLSPIQLNLVQNMLDDMEENGDSDLVEALSAALDGDNELRDKLTDDQREAVRDELVGRVQQARENGSINPEDATDLVQRADAFYGDVPNDPNDGLLEPVRAPAPDAPPNPAQVQPGAPPGQENRYHAQGVIQARDGQQIAQGVRVQARRDGAQGVVVAVQQQPPYARIRFDDGRVLVRAGNQLTVLDQNAPAAPQAAPAPRVAPAAPTPDVPAPAVPDQAVAGIRALRQQIPTRIGRAGHADPQLVLRRNAGYALDDALQAIQRGDRAEAERSLTRAAVRLAGHPDDLSQVIRLRHQLLGEAQAPAVPGAPAPGGAGPGPAVQGINPSDWLTPQAPGNLGERALNPTPAGVNYGADPTTRPDAANPSATVDQFSAWGDRAGEITQAARTRAGLDALNNANNNDELMAAAASIFSADGQTTFGNKGYTVKVKSVDSTGSGFQVGFNIMDANGRRIPNAQLTRNIAYDSRKGKWYVYNAYMRFPESHQGGGFANAWNRNVENWAIANKFDRVAVSAGLDKGGLIWSLNGFHWSGATPREQTAMASQQLGRVERAARGNAPALRQVQVLRARMDAATTSGDVGMMPTPLEIALVGWRPGMKNSEWPGAKGLLGSGWNGVKPLTPDHPIWAQQDAYAKARAAAKRVSSNQNSIGEVADTFIRDLSQGQYVGLELNPAQTAEVVDVLSNQRSLAALTPETKRKLHTWVATYLNQHGGDAENFEDQYRLMRALSAEQIADAPPGDIGVGAALRGVPFADIQNNRVTGWNFENLGHAGGINTTYRATHQASGQTFFVKSEHRAVGMAAGRPDTAGRDAELDVNQLLRAAGGGWFGINEMVPSDVADDVIIMQRAGDNVDLVRRPQNASSSGAHAGTLGLGNLNDPSEAFRMYILDLAVGNADRHPGNWQVGQNAQGQFHMFPLDHGLAGGGNGWAMNDSLEITQAIPLVGQHGAYQALRQTLAKYDGHSVEYMARQIIKDYQDALAGGSTWYNPQFTEKVGQRLTELEQNIRALLQQMGK